MEENDIDRILAASFTGEKLSEEERCLLEEWKQEDGHKWFENELHELKELGKDLKSREDKNLVFARIEKNVRKQRKGRLFIRWSSIAASILLLAGVVGYLMYSQESEDKTMQLVNIGPGSPKAELVLPQGQVIELDSSSREILLANHQSKVTSSKNTLIYGGDTDSVAVEYHTVRIPLGGEFSLQLSDNTRVYLNSGSSLRYPVRFAGGGREVFLTGEGFFEVTKDNERPFIVKTEDVDVSVLGTSFNVNAYPDEKMVATTLVEGKVRVGYGTQKYDLDPGMRLVYDRENGTADVRVVDTELYTSWKDGYYYFKQESLEKIMDVLARWYNLNVFFQNSELKSMEFGGRLRRYENISYLLEKMEGTQDVKFVINGNTIIIKRKTD